MVLSKIDEIFINYGTNVCINAKNTTQKQDFPIVKPTVLVDESPVIFTPFIRDPIWIKIDKHLVEIPISYWTKYTLNEALKILCEGSQMTLFVTDLTEKWELKLIPTQTRTVEFSDFEKNIKHYYKQDI